MAAIMTANFTADRLTGVLGARRVILAGVALLVGGCLAALGSTAGASYAAVMLPLVAEGFGLGLIVPAMTSDLR
jgi:uncharacterized protein involved in exopolysaccharide biosynthesis